MQIRPTPQKGWEICASQPAPDSVSAYALTLAAALLSAFTLTTQPVELLTGTTGQWIDLQIRVQTDQSPHRVLAQCRSVFDLVDLLGNELAGWELMSAKRVAG